MNKYIHDSSSLISNLKSSSNLSISISKNMMEIESPRRRNASPEFEFWMVGNSHPEIEPSGLLTADELFVDGVLLPLHLLSIPPPPPDPNPETEPKPKPKPLAHSSGFGSGPTKEKQESLQPPSASASASVSQEASICSTNPAASSKRWTDMFKVGDKKKESSAEDKEKKKERKATNGTADLNINIWPFSRSRSAAGRPKAAMAAMRKSSSAPCSRSNSRGENSGVRRWAASPGRPGVHVGRASPVWQGRRAGKGPEAGAGRAAKGGRPNSKGGMGLNVNSCIGYRNQVSWRGEDCDGGLAAVDTAGNNNNNANGSLFKFRALFSKKVY